MKFTVPELSFVVLRSVSGPGKSTFELLYSIVRKWLASVKLTVVDATNVRFLRVGAEDSVVGAPTQMGVFEHSV